ncbi:Dabb family protein [Halodesulfovibrio spirochaetisodalis]|uniref:Stress responsive protein n=1 Tax=Halodesulfovibrio spirochaetisodalis TaxID=1560234 RepID=A0A1B7X9N5_9BACT|nr:Dabb family protein [Halodesulfovibrio spirochaetisodalis]OBQ46056.1 stress responsive protein [Halodesulfovibrio spirochaetisodalis]
MIQHIVWFTMKEHAEGASANENAQKVAALLRSLEGKIPSLRSLEVSTDFASTTTEPIHVLLYATYDDEEGLKAYAEHPEHVAIGEFIRKVRDERKAIDFVV